MAQTARQLGFEVVVVSPEGSFTVEGLQPVLAATKKAAAAGGPERRTKRAVKDLRQWARQRRFAERAVSEVRGLDAPFVLTRHVLFGSAGKRCAEALGVPLVTWVHAALVRESESWGNRRFASGLMERLETRSIGGQVVAVTQRVLDDLSLPGVALGNGTLLERFSTADQGKRIVWIGSFRGFHGIDTIVEAFDGLDGELVLVGRGGQRQRIADVVASRGLAVDLPGFVAPLELPEVLETCGVGVVASGVPLAEFHYSPVKLREYAAAGLVVCVPTVGEMAALAEEPWVVPHDNTEAGLRASLAEALVRCQDASIRSAARAYAAEHYSWVPWWRGVFAALDLPLD